MSDILYYAPGSSTVIDHNFKPDQEIERLQARLAEVDKTLRPLVDDDNRPVEALARHAVARLAEAESRLNLAEAEVTMLRHFNAEAEADLRVAFGWGDPFDMTPEDAKVWHRLQAKYEAADSASGAWDRECVKCACKWVEAKAGPNCPRCGGEDFYGLPKGNITPDQPSEGHECNSPGCYICNPALADKSNV